MADRIEDSGADIGAPHEDDSGLRGSDMRLVLPAVAVWLGMWLVTGWSWGIWAVGSACGICCGVLVVRRIQSRSGPTRHVGSARSGPWNTAQMVRRNRHKGQRGLLMPGSAQLSGSAQPGRTLWLAVLALMLGITGVVGGLRVSALGNGPLAQGARNHSVADVQVQVQNSRLSPTWGMAVVTAVCERADISGHSYRLHQPVVLIVPAQYAGQWLAYPAGSLIAVNVRLAVPEAGEGISATLSVLGQSHLIRAPPFWQRVIESMRSGLVRAMENSPADQAALVPGLVVGDTTAMSAELLKEFRATGLTHLTAVSGANLAILLSFLSVVARYCGARGRWLTVISVAGVAVFIALCHSEPSVLRASAMGIVSLAALGRGGGQNSGLRGVCLAIMGLCWIDPWMSRSLGFILSVLACLGIIVWGRKWSQVLSRWLPGWVSEAMAIPLAAQVATQPVICWLSGAVSVSGLIANAAAGPWVAPATVIGLVAALISPVSSTLASWAGYVAGWCAQPILIVSHSLASLPGASHPWPTTAFGLGVVVVGCLVASWVMPLVLARSWLVLSVSAALVATMLIAPYQPGWPGQDWRIAACDVGQGDSVAVRSGQSQAIVLDVGPVNSSVTSCLSQLGIKQIPLIVLTHFHADHAGAFAEVVAAFPVGALLVPAGGGDGSAVLRLAEEKSIPVSTAHDGMSTVIGDVRLTVISAPQLAVEMSNGEESSSENDESIISRVDTPQMSLLDTGDVEVAGQQTAMADPSLLRVDVLKVPHHGSARQDPDFLEATHARIALIGVGANNAYGHPADRTVKELVNDGMEVMRTDEHGSIALSHDSQWQITTQK